MVWAWPAASQAGSRRLKRGHVLRNLRAKFENFLKLFGKGNQRDKIFTYLQSNLMMCLKIPVSTGPVWELHPKSSYCKRTYRHMPISGPYIGSIHSSCTSQEINTVFTPSFPSILSPIDEYNFGSEHVSISSAIYFTQSIV